MRIRKEVNIQPKVRLSKVVLTLFLSLAMTIGAMPGTSPLSKAYARLQGKTITGFGIGAITDPGEPDNQNDPWQGCYVYYGKYDDKPMKYRVLSSCDSDILLDCDNVLSSIEFNSVNNIDWEKSTIREWLQGNWFYNNSKVFTTTEKNAINEKYSVDGIEDAIDQSYSSFGLLSEDPIFILSAEQAKCLEYGTSTYSKTCIKKNLEGIDSKWWLRSTIKHVKSIVAMDSNGSFTSLSAVDSCGVSPAFSVDPSNIIFSSLISGDSGQPGSEYKLTLFDIDMDIDVTDGSFVTRDGNVITVPYTIKGDNAGNATQVSVLITDDTYDPRIASTQGFSYQILSVDQFGTSGTGTFTLPDSYAEKNWGSDYYVYILAEDVNGEKESDYASWPTEIYLAPVITTQPQNLGLTYGYDSGTLSVEATANASHNMTYQWYINTSNSNAGGTAIVGATSSSYDIPTGKGVETTEYYYCIVTDSVDNVAVTSNVATVTVGKLASSVTKIPDAQSLSYTGSSQELVTAGEATGGKMHYAIGTNATDEPTSGWSTSIPKETNAGTYYVWYKVKGEGNYKDSPSASVETRISKVNDPAVVNNKATVNTGGKTIKLSDLVDGAKGNVSFEFANESEKHGCAINGDTFTSGDEAAEVKVKVIIGDSSNYIGRGTDTIVISVVKSVDDDPTSTPSENEVDDPTSTPSENEVDDPTSTPSENEVDDPTTTPSENEVDNPTPTPGDNEAEQPAETTTPEQPAVVRNTVAIEGIEGVFASYSSQITFIGKKASFTSDDVKLYTEDGSQIIFKKAKIKNANKPGTTYFKVKGVQLADKKVKKAIQKTKFPITIVAYEVTEKDVVTIKTNSKGNVKSVTVNGIKLKKSEYSGDATALTFSGRFSGSWKKS